MNGTSGSQTSVKSQNAAATAAITGANAGSPIPAIGAARFWRTPPTVLWGGMLSDGRAHIRTYPHISLVPGIAITVTVLAFDLLGDWLRDALDPKQRD